LRGVKIRQPIQLKYEWRYLFLVVEPASGKLHWGWLASMKAGEIRRALDALVEDQAVDALVWDGAGSHKDENVRAVDLPQIALPPYSPELNPAERVFQELRRAIEGKPYPTLDAKLAAVEEELAKWDADLERVRSLTYYPWIQANLASLPESLDSLLPIAA
jgi:transposase